MSETASRMRLDVGGRQFAARINCEASMKLSACRLGLRTTLVLAALAPLAANAWDNSAQIAQQQRDAARMAADRAMQDRMNAQRQADAMQAQRLNDARQETLRKSAERVYGLDKPLTTPNPAVPPAMEARLSTGSADPMARLQGGAPFPAHSAWADLPGQRGIAFRPDGSFKLLFPKEGQMMRLLGRYEVDGQRVHLTSGNVVETFAWTLESAAGQDRRPTVQLRLTHGQVTMSWPACPACPDW